MFLFDTFNLFSAQETLRRYCNITFLRAKQGIDSSISFINNDFPQMFYFKWGNLEIADTIKTLTITHKNKWKYTWKRNQHRVINIRLKMFCILSFLLTTVMKYYFPLLSEFCIRFILKRARFVYFNGQPIESQIKVS